MKYERGVKGVPPGTELVSFIGAATDGFVEDAGGEVTPVVEGKNGSEKGCDIPAAAAEACSGVFDAAVDGSGVVGAALLLAGAVAMVRIEIRDVFEMFGLDKRASSVRRQLLHNILL